jgi:hypothetical protein
MKAAELKKAMGMLRELLDDLDHGGPDPRWRVRHHIARTVVRTFRLELEYLKAKAKLRIP